jgi:hypothetical protein
MTKSGTYNKALYAASDFIKKVDVLLEKEYLYLFISSLRL